MIGAALLRCAARGGAGTPAVESRRRLSTGVRCEAPRGGPEGPGGPEPCRVANVGNPSYMSSMSARLGSYLRALRKRRAVGLKEAAPAIGVSYTYLSKLENGLQDPSPDVMRRLADYYDTDGDVLGLLSGKLPDEILEALQGDPERAIAFLRRRFGAHT